jgi:pimeloyl-ACP methyl ester carboxylesterase
MSPALPVVMLPGLDGTGQLFEPFLTQLPIDLPPIIVRYPFDRRMGYSDLKPLIEAELPARGPFVLLGESFSSPLAVQFAADRNPRLAALVLAGGFVRSPVAAWLSRLRGVVGSWCFQRPPPAWAIRRYLAGSDAPSELVATVQSVIRTVSPSVLAHRVREVLAVDGRDALLRVQVPVLALAGSKDRLVSLRNVEDLRVLGNLLELELLDAPHLILQRQPAAAANCIAQFLNRRAGLPNKIAATDGI